MTDAISRQAVEKAVHDAIATQCLQNHKTSAGEYSAIAIAAVRAIPAVASPPTQSDALREENERLRALLARTVNLAEVYAEGTGTNFKEAMAEARAALQEQSK